MITLEHGPSVVRARPRLRFTGARGPEEVLLEETTTAGSADGAGIVLPDRTVSRLHAELDPRADGLWVRDLGSKNGTFVGDVRVEAGRVPDGAVVRLGAATVLVGYEPRAVREASWSEPRFDRLLGASPIMRSLFARLAKLAASDAPVLVRGETGTGKELVAEALHAASARRAGPFVVVDCGALPESLLEAELFGHARGAFTGASQARQGAFEAAAGGTVFLDEIGELPLALQPKLLRALEARRVRRVGETEHRAVDVRFVSATHRDLRRMVNEGSFREDLYFRLAVLGVEVPPLRERAGDVPLLLAHLLGPDASLATPEVLRALEGRSMPGNVRELRSFAERLRALGPEEAIATLEGREGEAGGRLADLGGRYREAREAALERFEREYFAELLARHEHRVAQVAQAAGVDRSYVHRMIRRHGL